MLRLLFMFNRIWDSVLTSSLCSRYADVSFVCIIYENEKLFSYMISKLVYRESCAVQVHIGIKKNQHVKVIFFLICRLEFVQCIVSYFKMSHTFLKIECPIGYYRSNCSEACKFSHFGKECQDKCNCSPHLCDHITGCYGMSHAYIN